MKLFRNRCWALTAPLRGRRASALNANARYISRRWRDRNIASPRLWCVLASLTPESWHRHPRGVLVGLFLLQSRVPTEWADATVGGYLRRGSSHFRGSVGQQ